MKLITLLLAGLVAAEASAKTITCENKVDGTTHSLKVYYNNQPAHMSYHYTNSNGQEASDGFGVICNPHESITSVYIANDKFNELSIIGESFTVCRVNQSNTIKISLIAPTNKPGYKLMNFSASSQFHNQPEENFSLPEMYGATCTIN